MDKYYIGHTEMSVEERLKKHLTDHDGFTSKAKDWQIAWSEEFSEKSEAYALERKMKGWKSKKAIDRLIRGV